MRWFFVLLLFANIGYVTWELSRDRSQQKPSVALPKNVERLVLLSELEQEASQHQVSDVVLEPDITVMTADVAEVSEQPAQQADAPSPDLAAVDDVRAPASEAVIEEPAIAEVELPVDKPAGELCYTLGPFREMNTLRVVTREIKDYVIEASFRSREEREQSMFRVYLKPVSSKSKARALIKELNSKNIRDHFIIIDGPLKNGISLGYFSDKKRAYSHTSRVRKLGFDALIEPVFRSYTIYWLDYRIGVGNEIPQQIFDQHLDKTTQRLSRSCA